jgi:hypothetical protein
VKKEGGDGDYDWPTEQVESFGVRQEKLDAIDQIRNGFLDLFDARVSTCSINEV